MTNKDRILPYHSSGSFHIGDLPEGCVRCLRGEKLVIFVTGKCSIGCNYCTIASDQKSKNRILANEVKLDVENAMEGILEESIKSEATGAGLTGGDPLELPQRSLKFISTLRKAFGNTYHTHLYTSGKALLENYELSIDLFDAGLDELRLHPKDINDQKIWKLAAQLKKDYPRKSIGFEIPGIQTKEDAIQRLIKFADLHSLDFVIINEFEFSEANFTTLQTLGFKPTLSSSAVKGSITSIRRIVEKLQQEIKIPVHFCSSRSKDAIQLTRRYQRRAQNIARLFDAISNEGELEYGKFYTDTTSEFVILLDLLDQIGLDSDQFEVQSDLSVETSWIVVDEFTDTFREIIPNLKAEIICRHPIEHGPITWKDPK